MTMKLREQTNPLDHDHDRLLRLLTSMVLALCVGEREACVTALDRFVIAFDIHNHYEERDLFPRYAANSAAAAAEVEVFMKQHAQLRALLGDVSVGIRAHKREVQALMEFEQAWTLHDAAEAREFVPWLRSQARGVRSDPWRPVAGYRAAAPTVGGPGPCSV